jgi:hypothetical protein
LNIVTFTDRDLGKRFAEILRSGDLTVERHADHFAPDASDEICRRAWIALTDDRRIRYKPNELDAVMRHGVALVVIIGAARFLNLAYRLSTACSALKVFLPGTIRH